MPGSTLIPQQDASLLFTNAGMNQFKKVFLGTESPPHPRVTSVQRCIRAGGKHNDLDNVGYTARHHTFFEMLGNFSFGDYFKREAIQYAWEFLTQVLKLPESKLWITIFYQDEEAEDIWLKEIGINPARFSKLKEEDNFWSMGDTGPCGPCCEIFYDHGEAIEGDPPGGTHAHKDRYVEIWNMVFMQYNKTDQGELIPLMNTAIDTGMGLERISAILQNVSNNYDTDCFQPIILKASQLLNQPNLQNVSLRVISDHIRAAAFLIADGILPGNEGRGYVLRRLIRRACRHGYQLGQTTPFFYQLIDTLIDTLGDTAQLIAKNQDHIAFALKQEETQFQLTLARGMERFEADLLKMKTTVISGETIFTLHDTYGFPVDLISDIARERNLSLNLPEYQDLMTQQRQRARSAHQFNVNYNPTINQEAPTQFIGYTEQSTDCTVLGLYVEGKPVSKATSTLTGPIALLVDKTPFYAESGGQIGDTGYGSGEGLTFNVMDTKKSEAHYIHLIQIQSGELHTGQSIQLSIDSDHRNQVANNHSATHLLHAALREVLGQHVSQKGSLVTAHELRFDFSHPKAITPEEWVAIEDKVNQQIQYNQMTSIQNMSFDTAIEQGAMALFDEKYNDTVRVLTLGKDHYSIELCGGTHVTQTGDIGLFVLQTEASISSGVRRITALTGPTALKTIQSQRTKLQKIQNVMKGTPDNITDKIFKLIEKSNAYEKKTINLQKKIMMFTSEALVKEAVLINKVQVISTLLEAIEADALHDMVDLLKQKLSPAVIVLASQTADRTLLTVGISKPLTQQLNAGQLLKQIAGLLEGKGGGRSDFAQGSAPNSSKDKLMQTLNTVTSWVDQHLA